MLAGAYTDAPIELTVLLLIPHHSPDPNNLTKNAAE